MAHRPDYSQYVDIQISEKACDGCGLCVDFCPVGVLEMGGNIPKVIKLTACYDCGTCEEPVARGKLIAAIASGTSEVMQYIVQCDHYKEILGRKQALYEA